MYLIYLDWNAMGGLRGTPTGEFIALANLLEQHRNRFWIPYSSTHLDDLARGYDPNDEKKVDFTHQDLAFIRRLTKNACFQAYNGQERPEPDRRDPAEFFESHYAAQQEDAGLLSAFTNIDDDASTELKSMAQALLNLPAPSFPSEARGTLIEATFPGWSVLGTMHALLQDFDALVKRAKSDHTYSTELRDVIRTGIPDLDPKVVSSAAPGQAFTHIEKLLAPFMGGRSVFGMMDSNLKNHVDTKAEPTLEQRFIQAYYQLQLLNYHPDNIKPKNHFPNILGDATHAFLAGHCDFLVTNDKDLRHKAKAVYEKIRTNTRVVSVKEFVELMPAELLEYTPQTYPHHIAHAITTGHYTPEMRDENEDIEGCVLLHRLFDYFNAYEIICGRIISFFRIETTYRNFTFTSEVKGLVLLLSQCLGPDDNGQTEADIATEIKGITADDWPGRQWTGGVTTAKFTWQQGEPRLAIEFL